MNDEATPVEDQETVVSPPDIQPRKRRRGKWLFEYMLLFLVIAAASSWVIYTRPMFFFIQAVAVDGNRHLETEEIYRVLGLEDRKIGWIIDGGRLKRLAEEDLRVESIDFFYEWPGYLTMIVKERQSIAYMATQYGFVEIDSTGMVLALVKNLKQLDAPFISGIKPGYVYAGDKLSTEGLNGILLYLRSLDDVSRDKLSEINIAPGGEMLVYTTEGVRIKLGNQDRIAEKAKLTREILQEMSVKKIPMESIDLTHGTAVMKFK